jgi:hypothetical protein
MSGVAAVTSHIPGCCESKRCDKDGCRVSLKGIGKTRVLVDMDCRGLPIPKRRKRCDYLLLADEPCQTWIVPIELKSGGLKATDVVKQLQGGADTADTWLPKGISFELTPILAHGKSVHRQDLRILRTRKIQLRGKKKTTALIRCGDPLTKALR